MVTRMRTLPLTEVHATEGNCVSRVPLFAGLTPQEQDRVALTARPRLVAQGELVHRAGERAGQLSVVHSGRIKLSRTLPSGRERLLRVVEPGQTLDERTFLDPDATLDQAEAMTDARLCVFFHDDIARIVAEHPDIAMRMLRNLSDRLAQAERALSLSALGADIRVADYLLDQPLRRAPNEGAAMQVRLPLSKKDVASLLGITPESFSRALARLRAGNMISVNGDIVTIHDPVALDVLVADA